MKKQLQMKIKRKSLSFLWLFFSLFVFFGGTVQAQNSSLTIGTEHKIRSGVLNEERKYYVSLPASYNGDDFYIDKKYPILILLDGDSHFQSASGMIRFMSGNEQIPEMIIVAVTNTDRTRDMTSFAAANASGKNDNNFLQFIETELLPQIERNYRTLPYRILIGHSLAGLFTVNTFVEQRTFNAFLAIDPSLQWFEQLIVKKAENVLAKNRSFKSSLYISQANNPFDEGKNKGIRGESFQRFVASLAANKSEGLRYKYDFYENEDHFSVPLESIYHGLLFIFDGYKFPLNTLSTKTSADVKKHYEKLFKNLGANLQPPGKLLNNAALFLLNNEGKTEQAIELLKLNREYYPNTFVTHESLGDAYRKKGDKESAIASYKKSLKINPKNERAERFIKELSKN